MGLIHLDAGIIIGLLDADDVHHDAATVVASSAQRNGDRLAMSASAVAECLVGPARRSDAAVDVVISLLARLPIDVVALDISIARTAVTLRARHHALRLPDALVIATAVEAGASELITTDRGWPTRSRLRIDVPITRL